MTKLLQKLTDAFPIWVLAGALLSLYHPPLFTWFTGKGITAGLGIIMLGMGLTLSWRDFKIVFQCPTWVGTGVLLQYTVMPLLGWFLSYLFKLPPAFAAGLVLVACCPGGTASNVVCYIARLDVPLSVTMTACSTLLAVITTPLLSAWLIGSRIEVNPWGLFWSTIQVVILPIALGIFLNRYFKKCTEKIIPFSPLVAVLFITLIVASIVGQGRELILQSGVQLILAVFSLHAGGFLLGYIFSRRMIRSDIPAKTISIEVGMQNSGLGVVLAKQNFTDPAVAIPSAISSVMHSLIASLLGAFWRWESERLLSKTRKSKEGRS